MDTIARSFSKKSLVSGTWRISCRISCWFPISLQLSSYATVKPLPDMISASAPLILDQVGSVPRATPRFLGPKGNAKGLGWWDIQTKLAKRNSASFHLPSTRTRGSNPQTTNPNHQSRATWKMWFLAWGFSPRLFPSILELVACFKDQKRQLVPLTGGNQHSSGGLCGKRRVANR